MRLSSFPCYSHWLSLSAWGFAVCNVHKTPGHKSLPGSLSAPSYLQSDLVTESHGFHVWGHVCAKVKACTAAQTLLSLKLPKRCHNHGENIYSLISALGNCSACGTCSKVKIFTGCCSSWGTFGSVQALHTQRLPHFTATVFQPSCILRSRVSQC